MTVFLSPGTLPLLRDVFGHKPERGASVNKIRVSFVTKRYSFVPVDMCKY